MKLKNSFTALFVVVSLSSCVSSKIYEDLKENNNSLKEENAELLSQIDGVPGGASGVEVSKLRGQMETLTADKMRAEMELAGVTQDYNRLKESYDALAENSSENLAENLERNRKLLAQLEEKERLLNQKEIDLNTKEQTLLRAQKELEASSNRVAELESIIAAKDAKMRALKNAISAALSNFEGNGLTVEQRDGKVYVSMENKLLFASGSWDVNNRGREAVVELGKVLGDNKEIAVLIEGHTDNVPYGEKGLIKNNWDLSTKRATAIVNILTENDNIPKENLTAAGRGEFAPLVSNTTTEGRAKNRRIEVILTPKLDEISKLLNEM
ncbi:OmpA/MotB family protein [Patiriisocius marinus]|uniref:OmpA/MotB family protein n=1 Tax=Patiriisocius marinus TaxID=1397112 RepID=UPI00232E3B1D|nr:OmpA family protein [Patiriisocius marinus]